MAATDASLLPPNATALEKALALRGARLQAIDLPVGDLYAPADCAISVLPWMAWQFAVDRWDSDWSEDTKRATYLGAIPTHRRRGSITAVRNVLASFDSLLTLVQWHEATPRLTPHTFEVHLPAIGSDGVAGGTRVSAATAQSIITEVTRAAPARSWLTLVVDLSLAGLANAQGAARTATAARLKTATDTSGTDWAALLTDQNGEPLTDDAGTLLDTSTGATA